MDEFYSKHWQLLRVFSISFIFRIVLSFKLFNSSVNGINGLLQINSYRKLDLIIFFQRQKKN